MHTKLTQSISLLVLLSTVSGCSVLMANNRELLDARAQMDAGDEASALDALDPGKRDDLCAKLERAMIYAECGHPARSNAEFDRAIEQIREYEDRATVSATEVGRGTGSLLLNDKSLEYQSEGFEKVLIRTFKARNYLMLGDMEAARVEIRNANMRQEEEAEKHEEEIASAKDEAEKKGTFNALQKKVDDTFATSSDILSRLDNVYQNPFATYLSGIVYELNDELDDAFIDFEKAYQMTSNPLVASELSRLAVQLHREDDLEELGLEPEAPAPAGNTVVFLDNGFAPGRVEIKFPIPEPDTILFAAVPMTKSVATNLSEAEILDVNGRRIGQTHIMVDIEAMTVRNLHDRYPAILLRQAIRLGAKAAVAHVAKKEAGLAGMIVTSVFNAVTEQADLRGWYNLPRSIHVARVNVPDGQNEIRLRLLNDAGRPIGQVTAPVITAGPRLKVVLVRYLTSHVLGETPQSL